MLCSYTHKLNFLTNSMLKKSIAVFFAVLMRECTTCGHVRSYCGSDDGILNMRSFLIGHDVLRDYLHSFLSGNR